MASKSTRPPSPSKTTRILLVDDHPLVRAGLAEVLTREPDLVICGEAEDRLPALALMATARPDLAIIDLRLKKSHGLELIKDIHAQFPNVRMLVVSTLDGVLHAQRALQAGASGYIGKEEAIANVTEAVRQVLRGELYVSQRIACQITANLVGHGSPDSVSALAPLTDRELQVFQLLGEGCGRQEIAERLHLDVNTVETYRARIKDKLRLKDAQELLQFAIRYYRGRD
jgi:DNA-binding NarL/FixJ family response regulator